MRILAYILFIFDCLLIMGLISFFEKKTNPIPIHLQAIQTDNLLLNARAYIQEAAYRRSHENLKKALDELKYIQEEADALSKVHIHTALEDLKIVEAQMASGNFFSDSLNKASVVALNALTYYQIKSAEEFFQKSEYQNAVSALKFGMLHVKNALVFAEGNKKDHEVQIFSEMNAIIKDPDPDKSLILPKLEKMLAELEDLEIAYHH